MPETGKKPTADECIGPAIAKSLRGYLAGPQDVVVYICDEEGSRAKGLYRQKLFRDWHRLTGDGYHLYQFSPQIKTPLGSCELYAGIIYRSDCPKMQEVISLIKAAAPDIIRAKYLEP